MCAYEPQAEEKKILDFWKKEKIYKFKADKKTYSVDTPPPTLSGEMHIGHAFSYSQQDFIVRFNRMKNGGKGVFYPFGTDDNGLPTERLVERLKNVRSKEMTRADFIKLCQKTLGEIRPAFIQDWKNLGVSCDYDLYYSTIDENSRRISQKNFIELYKKKLAYQKEFPTLWCPECQTAIAQAELEDKEVQTNFVTIKFSAEGKDLLIATTRPELLGACVAVFVNPTDKRYKHLKGKKAKVPLVDLEVPILMDDSVLVDKGTGAMMVCSYGDKYDLDKISRYKLTPRVILDRQGKITEGLFVGMRAKQARNKFIEELEKKNLVKEKIPRTHVANVHDKCGTPIEFVETEQWFIKVIDKKKDWIFQGNKINWFPEHMKKRYDNWVEGLDWDWNVSRDRHFGVPIPVWYCEKCKETIVADEKELPVDPLEKKKKCPKCKSEAKAEEKVLDTWATSSLSPVITNSLVGNKLEMPFSLRPQAHDIIRTWAFYTIVKSYLTAKELPWKDIIISGNVSLKGEKMSKSKGNVIDPKAVIAQYGADALRFWAASSKLGEDLDYQEKDLVTGKKFVNKLLNATNFAFMNMKSFRGKKPKKLVETDEVFLKVLGFLVNEVTEDFEAYNYSGAKLKLEQFFWQDLCDNYLEIAKWRVYNGSKEEKDSAFYTLYTSLLTILKMVSPITPFITEHIYQEHFRKSEDTGSIHISDWPASNKSLKKDDSEEQGKWNMLTKTISMIRKIKSENQKSMNAEMILKIDKNLVSGLGGMLPDLQHTVNAKEIKTGDFKVEFV